MKTARPGHWCLLANGTLMARTIGYGSLAAWPGRKGLALTWAFALERVTGIEPALSAWEAAGALWPTRSICGHYQET